MILPFKQYAYLSGLLTSCLLAQANASSGNIRPRDEAFEQAMEACSDYNVTLSLNTDDYGAETSWKIRNNQDKTLYTGSGYDNSQNYQKLMCLEAGQYTLEFLDSEGDGICCQYGNGTYSLKLNEQLLASGGRFDDSIEHHFVLGEKSGEGKGYYQSAQGKSGYELKTALHNIIKNHQRQSYSAVWSLVKSADIDRYYENDGSILDIYSENVSGPDSINYVARVDQCGNYRREGDCYNREHSFPKSWFGGKVAPMNTDGHHLFASDGYVNAKRGNWPFGEVGVATYQSSNGSKLGYATSDLNYSGTVFEPVDQFKGDLARVYFYMATRYQHDIAYWEGNTSSSDAVLNGTPDQVFESWALEMFKRWHLSDPVDQKERDRNEAVFQFQNNRNPFVDHPEFVLQIWGN
ncbi:Extracellular ribonuclease [Vibrio aquimaris]|uniref:Extracellular ribonuclease n=1 Tax=Vibrio aquimaris TaxID=2587862 RepID=A0A5P9CQC8_9VIBR|nr:Extracellular ribonuclease precursor [Vibrio aquimaris]